MFGELEGAKMIERIIMNPGTPPRVLTTVEQYVAETSSWGFLHSSKHLRQIRRYSSAIAAAANPTASAMVSTHTMSHMETPQPPMVGGWGRDA